MSAWLGSLPLPEKLTAVPSLPLYGPPASAVGATFVTTTSMKPSAEPPSSSVTRMLTLKVPLSSKKHIAELSPWEFTS